MTNKHHDLSKRDRSDPRIPFGPDFQSILALIGDAVVSTDNSGNIILFNNAAEVIFGYRSDEILGLPIDVLIPVRFHHQHQIDHGHFCAVDIPVRRVMGAGREVRARRKDGTEFLVEISLSRQLLDGHHIGTAVIRDVSIRIVAEKQRELVANEVAHRLRNTMAVINSIVTLTANGSTSAEEFKTALLGRFDAISRTNESLIRSSWVDADLRELIESELAPYRCDTNMLTLEGPDIAIDREIAVALALVFHELATNASKYGALSSATGQVVVRWRAPASEKTILEVEWHETGGPPVVPPTRRGFGTELISKGLRSHGGKTELTYATAGVSCSLSLPLS